MTTAPVSVSGSWTIIWSAIDRHQIDNETTSWVMSLWRFLCSAQALFGL